jgi:hypothetical protein
MPPQDGQNVTRSSPFLVAAAWVAVGIPMLWGVLMTVKKTAQLFR